MIFSETIEGAVASLFFFDKATQSKRVYLTEEDSCSYGHCGWYIALGVCLFLGLKVLFKRYFPSKNTSQAEVSQKKAHIGDRSGDTSLTISRHRDDPMRSIQLPRAVRKSLQEQLQTKSASTIRSYSIHSKMTSPQRTIKPTAEVSKMSEPSSRYQDAVSCIGQSLQEQASKKRSIKISPKSLQESSGGQYSTGFPRSAKVALMASHSLVPQGDSKLIPQMSQKQRCQHIETAQSQNPHSDLTPEEKATDCNLRCISDLQQHMKLPLYLTNQNPASGTQKMRSVFSRTKLGKECKTDQNTGDDLRFEDGTCCFTFVKSRIEQEINATLKATTTMGKKMGSVSEKNSGYAHASSHKESQQRVARSGVKKKSVVHFRNEEGYSVGSLGDVYTSLMCLNKTQRTMIAPVLENKDFHGRGKTDPRKWLKVDKDRQRSYQSCPIEAPILFEIFPTGAFQGAANSKADRRCYINEASFDKQRALKRNRRISVSKNEHSESMAVDILEIVATKTQPKDLKKSKSSKVRSARKRKQVCSDHQTNILSSQLEEDRSRSLIDKENDTCSSFIETDISLCVERRTCKRMLQSTKEKQKGHSLKDYDIHQTATEVNLAKHDHSTFPYIGRKEPPRSTGVHTKMKHKNNTDTLPLHDPRAENIHMVESLLSVTGAQPTISSPSLAAKDSSISRNLDFRKGKPTTCSLTARKAHGHSTINPAITSENMEVDFMKTSREQEHVKNKKTVKKNLRFAADTEIYGEISPGSCTTMISPFKWNRSQTFVTPTPENITDGKKDAKPNKTHQKRAKNYNNFPKFFDKLVFENKEDAKNSLRICQSAEPSTCETVYCKLPQSPASVRVKKSSPKAKKFTTLSSFLDHKETERNSLKDGKYKQAETKKGLAKKYSTGAAAEGKWMDKDAIVNREVAKEIMACLNGSKLGTSSGEVKTEETKIDPLTCTNLKKPPEQQETQKQHAVFGLHFGTDNLQLYSESIDSISFSKTDIKNKNDVQDLLQVQRRAGSCPKKQSGMKYVPFSNTDNMQRLRRPKTESKVVDVPPAAEEPALKKWGRNRFRIIKKDVNKMKNSRDNNSMHKVVTSVLNSRKLSVKANQKDGHQCAKRAIQSSMVKLKSKTSHGLTQSLFAIPDPTRGSENTGETEHCKPCDRDSSKVADVQRVITEKRTEGLSRAATFDAAGNIDTFKDIISLEQPTFSSPMSVRSIQLSTPDRTRSVDGSSPDRIFSLASDPSGQVDPSRNEMKAVYPGDNKTSSPDTKISLILKAEESKTPAPDALAADNTPSRIRKRIRRLKTCSLGHVINKLSEAESKPPKGEAFRDTDLSSTSKSVTSTDINVIHPTPSTAADTKNQMPVIVKKLIIDSSKLRSDTLKVTSSCGKQILPQEASSSQVQNLLPVSFSHSHQPLQSIHRGSLKDIFDRYVVHTSEYSQRHAARTTTNLVRPTRQAGNYPHLSHIDHDATRRSPMVTSYHVKPELSQRSISSYTSKYRANDNVDKCVKPNWRGTVAFRKRLQHLLQHNKHIQDKYGQINTTSKKISSVELSDGKSNMLSASKDTSGNIYKVSRILRPGQVVLGQINEMKHNTLLATSDPGKANIYSARKVVTPVSKLLDVRDEVGDLVVDNSKKHITAIAISSLLQDKTTDEDKTIAALIPSPTASDALLTFTSPQKVINSSKSTFTHSDHFEHTIQCQLKRQNEAIEQKLSQMKVHLKAKPLPGASHSGISMRSSIPCSVSNRKILSNRPRLAWLQTQLGKAEEKQQETVHHAAEATDLIAADEDVKSTVEVDLPCTITLESQQTSHSETTVAETVTTTLRNTVRVVSVDSSHSVLPSDVQAEVTRCDFFTPTQQQAAGDTRFTATIRKDMAHVSETEHNLQMLLDKIKQRSFLSSPTNRGKEKENVEAPTATIESPDVNMNTDKQTKSLLKQRQHHKFPSTENSRGVTEQTKANPRADRKTSGGITCTTSDIFPPSLCRKQKENSGNQKMGADIKRMHEGTKKSEHRLATKVASSTAFTVTNRKNVIMGKDNPKLESNENTKTDEKTKASAKKLMYNKYKIIPRNKAKRTTSLMDKKPCLANEPCTTSMSSVKHVAFNLNEQVDKSNTDSFGTIISEVVVQKSPESCSVNWCKEPTDDDTDAIYSQSSKTATLHNKVRQAMSVLNILSPDEAERADKNAARKDIQTDQVSDTSHTYEKQQSSTEATGKLPCSSGYGTMDIVSTASFSQLQNSSSGEPGKLVIEPVPAGEVCTPGSFNNTDDDAYDHSLKHPCQQKEVSQESSEHVDQVNSLAISLWKKELHMDVIPEEADCENSMDSHTEVESGKSKLSEIKITRVEKENVECTGSKEYGTESATTSKHDCEIITKTEADKVSIEHDTVHREKFDAGENANYQVINTPVATNVLDGNYMEISSDGMESCPETYVTKRTDPIKTQEVLRGNTEDTAWNHGEATGENSQANGTDVAEQTNKDSLSSPHLYKAVTETILQVESSQAHLKQRVALNESYACSLHPTSGTQLVHLDLHSTSLNCLPFANKKESQNENINEVDTILNSRSNTVLVKDSSSLTTEPKNERAGPSNYQTCASVCAKTLDNYSEVLQSKSNSAEARHEVDVYDVMSKSEANKHSMCLGEKNKSDLTTVPIKSTTFDVQGMKSSSSLAEQSYESSDNSLSEGVFKCGEDLEATTNMPTHEEINTKSATQKVGNISKRLQKEDGDANKVNETTLKTVGSSSPTEVINYNDEDTFQKLPEPCTANILAQGDSTISQNMNLAPEDLHLRDKLTPDTNVYSLASIGSETTTGGYSKAATAGVTTLDHQPTAETQTTELDLYDADGVQTQKSVGLQAGQAGDVETTRSFTDNAGYSWNREASLQMKVSPVPSLAEVSKTEKCRKEKTPDTRGINSSNGRRDNLEENDKPAETVCQEQNVNANKDRSALKVEISREQRCVIRRSRQRAPSEGISPSVVDDLESLLNNELSHVKGDGGLKEACDVNRLFGTYERNRRREKRRRRAETTLSQPPSHRELQYHYLRENDGSVKRTSSSISQRTVYSPNDMGMQHSHRVIRPLAPRRVTKLEEFLQRAEESNRSETMSNISRAVSKLSSFTSVTPSSQEEQMTPFMYQTRSGNKSIRHKVSETECSGNCDPPKIKTVGGVSQTPSRVYRAKNLKASQLHSSKTSENEYKDSNRQLATCTSTAANSPFPDGVSDCTRNNDDSHVSYNRYSRVNIASGTTAEQSHIPTVSSQTLSGGYSSVTIGARANDNIKSWLTAADRESNTGMIKNETSRTIDAAGPGNNANKQMFKQPQAHATANTDTVQATDECSALSSSSSSIVLSWIGSDLGDTEELTQITPNFTDQEDKLCQDDVMKLNNYRLQIPETTDASEFPHLTEDTQQPHHGCQLLTDISELRRSTFIDAVSHSPVLNGNVLQMSERRMPGCTKKDCEKSRISYLGENVEDYELTKLKQSKDALLQPTWLPNTEPALFKTHKKDEKQTSQSRLPIDNYLKCPQKDKFTCSSGSPKTSKQLCSFWNSNPKECTLEQPSYFNALLRDPKWNPSFDIKEVSIKSSNQSEEPSAAGSYVQSAWTYQRVTHMSPSIFSPHKDQENSSPVTPQTIKQQSKAHEKPGEHLVTTTAAQRSNTNICENWSINSNKSDRDIHQYPTTQMSPKHTFMLKCFEKNSTIQHDKGDQKDNIHTTVPQDVSRRGITKQNTFLRKVHFDSNFTPDKTGPVFWDYTTKSAGQSRVPVYNRSTEARSLDKHLKASSRSGAMPVKDRQPSEQRSQGPEATKTKTKMSLEQHLCSTFDTDRSAVSNAAQPSSENGTATKSTSSHASINWYKPQSLPSSTSVSNGHQEASQPQTHHNELGISPTNRPSTQESSRRQDTHTLEHSMINLALSLPSITQAKAGSTQRNKKDSHGTRDNLSTQTMIPILIPRAEKGSSESLLTYSSTSAHSLNKYPVAGLWWLRDPGSSRGTQNTLPQSPSGSNSRLNGNKSTRRLTNTSNQTRTGSKTSSDCEVQTLASQSRGLSTNNRKSHSVRNHPSSYSSPGNSEKGSEVNNVRSKKVGSSHVQSLKKSHGSSDCSATYHSSGPRTSVGETRDTTRVGTQSRTAKPSDRHASSSDPVSPFKGTRRVSKLVEMFEKKRES